MTDGMFPGSSALGDSVQALFSSGADAQTQFYQAQMRQARLARAGSQEQNQGVRDMPSTNGNAAAQNTPQYGNDKNRPTATTDPSEVEQAWMARLAKFAGIAGSTGVKLGSR
jgi:hypothetical protein